MGDFLSHWTRVTRCRKPVIAAVNGFAVSVETRHSIRFRVIVCKGIIWLVLKDKYRILTRSSISNNNYYYNL